MNASAVRQICIALAAAGAAASASARQTPAPASPVQLYGRLNVALEHISDSGPGARAAIASRLSNYRSVLGFMGSEDLGDGVKALFQIEGTLSPDTGQGGIAQRDTRVGLASRYGTVFAGNWTTPYNSSTSPLDPFYPTTAGYMSIMGNGSASTADNVSDTASFDRRQQNSVHYWTPNWRGLSLRVAQGLNEERPASGARPALSSAALIYDSGAWYGALAHERHREYQGPRLHDSGSKIALAYRMNDTRVAAVAEKLRYETAAGTLERNAYYVSLTQQWGRHGLRLGLARAGDGAGSAGSAIRVGFLRNGAGTGATHATIGYDYNLSRRSSLFAFFTRLHNERNGVYDFAINSVGGSGRVGDTLQGAALGMRHNF